MTENPEMFFVRKHDRCQSVKEDLEELQEKWFDRVEINTFILHQSIIILLISKALL